MRSGFFALIGKAAGIVAVGAGLGLGVNALRADGLSLGATRPTVGDDKSTAGSCSAGPTTNVPEASIDEARALYGKPGVTFVDARSRADFERGHVKGAVLLPYEAAAAAAGQASLPVPTDHRLIVYCEYVNCQLSSLLAQLLSQSGCERVRVLKGGYPAWASAGLPTGTGP
ncbi:MAG: rhodanese-like domain-containing protein [Deltaproteobacteria bacterium]|nr:rhodanese-like domain-containing protein [Deltaproteobacteria bacterium]